MTTGESRVDVVVVGVGPGGEFAANKLAGAGLRVVAIDKHLVGGECPFYGCIPSKILVRAADAVAESNRARTLAGVSATAPTWSPVAERIRRGTRGWSDAVSVQRLEQSGARVIHGEARLLDARTVVVAGERLHADLGVVLATGTSPGAPPVEGLSETPYWTNRDVFAIADLPTSLGVIGAGPIGCELAQVFARFGVQVTLLESTDRILAVEEPETSSLLAEVLVRDGVRVMPGVKLEAVSYADGLFSVSLAGESVEVEKLLVATGRDPNLGGLGLETVGVSSDGRSLDTDPRMRVLNMVGEIVEGLWAVGDIVGKGLFTHTAKYQAGIVVRQLLGQEGPEADFRAVPRVTFTDPEIGSVGLSEAEAREQGRQVRTGFAALGDSPRGGLHGPGNDGHIKLVAEGDLLIGATSVGPSGGEVLAMLTTAIHGRVPIETLRSMIYAYPTFHGVVRQALSDLD